MCSKNAAAATRNSNVAAQENLDMVSPSEEVPDGDGTSSELIVLSSSSGSSRQPVGAEPEEDVDKHSYNSNLAFLDTLFKTKQPL